MDTTRTFIIFTTLLCVWAGPILNQDKPILKLMLDDDKACNFPPREVLIKPTRAPYILSCNNKQIPDYSDFGEGLEGIQAYANAAQDNDLLLCMGFYDLSLQLCKAHAPAQALPQDTKQFNSFFSDPKGDDTFCKKIQFYVDQHTSFPITSDWLTVLNTNLKTESNCKSVCTFMTNGLVKVRPICKILLWGRHLLHDISTSQAIPQQRKLPTEEVELSHEQLREGDIPAYADQVDLEAKDIVLTDNDKSTSKALDISMQQKNEPSNTLVSGLKELSNPSTKEQTTPDEQQPIVNSKESKVNVSPSFETAPVVVIEPKPDISIQVTDAVDPVKKSEEVKPENVVIEAASSSTKSSTTIGQSTSSPSSPKQESALVTDQKSYSEPENTLQDTVTTDSEEQYAEQPVEDAAVATFQNIDQADDDDDDFDQPEINHRKQQPGMRTDTFPESDMETHLYGSSTFKDAEDSHFFAYFLTLALMCILAYLAFHNKNKILALVLEGRKGGASRGGRSSRRPSTSSYRKLDSTLEEAISSAAPRTNPHVIY